MQSNQVCCPAADISHQLLHKNVGFQLLKNPRKYALLLVSFGFAKKKENTWAQIGAKFKGQITAGYHKNLLLFPENLL